MTRNFEYKTSYMEDSNVSLTVPNQFSPASLKDLRFGLALFLTFINDLPEYVHSRLHLFAGDTAMLLAIDSQEDSLTLKIANMGE